MKNRRLHQRTNLRHFIYDENKNIYRELCYLYDLLKILKTSHRDRLTWIRKLIGSVPNDFSTHTAWRPRVWNSRFTFFYRHAYSGLAVKAKRHIEDWTLNINDKIFVLIQVQVLHDVFDAQSCFTWPIPPRMH